MNKNELVNFLLEYKELSWEISGKVEEILLKAIDEFFDSNQPERLSEKTLQEGFFPPPWNFYEHPEKTEGWIEFQRAMRKDPKYYLQGSDSLTS
jgi:hypothetical protein